MSSQAIDLSAGLQPAPPPPQPSDGGIDLSAGLQSAPAATPAAQPSGLWNTIKDNMRSNIGTALDPFKGVGEGLMDTAATVGQLQHDVGEKIHHGLGESLAPQASIDATRQLAAPANTTQSIAKGTEGVAEFLLGDEALKGLSYGEKLSKVASVMTKLEKSPTMMNVVRSAASRAAITGARQGAVGTAQALAHGADIGDATKTGIVSGVTGGALEGAGAGISGTYDMIRPTEGTIAGRSFPKLRSQEPGGSKIGGSTAANTPAVAAAQQAAAQGVISDSAQHATSDAIDRVNAARGVSAPEANPARMLPAPADMQPQTFELPTGEAPEPTDDGKMLYEPRKKQIGTAVEAGNPTAETNSKGVRKVPIYQYLTGIKPGAEPAEAAVQGAGVLRTSDPAQAQSWLSRLNEADQAGALSDSDKAGRDALQQQLDMHHAGQNQRYIDPISTASQVRSYGEGADQVRASVRPIFQKLDEVSGGRFQMLKNAHDAGQQALQSATTDGEVAAAHAQIAKANDGINDLFTKHAGQVNRTDYLAAKSAWRDASDLDTIHNTVEGQFNGISPQTQADAAAQGVTLPRVLNKPNTNRIGRLEANVGLPRLKELLGQDGVVNLQQVNQLLQNPETRPKSFEYLMHAAHYAGRGGGGALLGAAAAKATGQNPYEGGAAGFMAGVGGRAVLRQMATNPEMGRLFTYAVKNGVNPKIAIPLISGTMAQATGGPQ